MSFFSLWSVINLQLINLAYRLAKMAVMTVKKLTYLLTLVLSCFACKTVDPTPQIILQTTTIQKPKNIVLMIGDGMGLSQVSAAIYNQKTPTHISNFPVVGYQKTHSFDNLITDSAAGATAIATGQKTRNNVVGLDTSYQSHQSILEEAEEIGLGTGIVTTDAITGATPASFYAHQKLRIMFEHIAEDLLKSGIDFFVGGGKTYFDNREDERNLHAALEDKGYIISDFIQEELSRINLNHYSKFGYFSANKKPLPKNRGRTYLPLASKMGVEFLDRYNEAGFFLVIEGAQIDWACHANQPRYFLDEIKDFDNAIGEVLKFAVRDKETLVIVTGDHETGGMAINPASKLKKLKLEFTLRDHTATMIPVYAYGPKAELFNGIYENTAIYHKMREALELERLSSSK